MYEKDAMHPTQSQKYELKFKNKRMKDEKTNMFKT